MASDLISHVCVVKPLERAKERGFRELLGWWTHGDLGRVAWSEKVLEALDSFLALYLALSILPSGCS